MRVVVHVDSKSTALDCIVIKRVMMQAHHMTGTVVLTDAQIGGSIKGTLVEEHDKRIQPHKSITLWPRLRYVTSMGYVDSLTGDKVGRAKAVYMVGKSCYYLPV